ncbi:ABC transporter permease [uncultured Meiothermus sp.]|jgi:spermidine/putrescine transport system permease protein|uniref:ABC transporter permease n=1 Tax=uncultured Meiothermus sp. TaxID=157471 RepID=UPI002621710F|nr:ABC transporter permease [uncultured Meiothermus sp.]
MRLNPLVGLTAIATLAFLYLPMLAVAVLSFNQTRFGTQWTGFTWDWYIRLLNNPDIQETARNTLFLALVSTLIATVLGTMLALALERYPWPKRSQGVLENILYLPIITPDIIFAVALVVAFGALRTVSGIFELGMTTMILGHVTFQTAFVALTVRSRLKSLGHDLDEAARDLYADYGYYLRRVLLPLLAPGIVAGAMLAFTLSLDDFVISFFTAGPTSQTLPLLIYASVRRGVTPEIHALSTLIFLATVLLVLASTRLVRR